MAIVLHTASLWIGCREKCSDVMSEVSGRKSKWWRSKWSSRCTTAKCRMTFTNRKWRENWFRLCGSLLATIWARWASRRLMWFELDSGPFDCSDDAFASEAENEVLKKRANAKFHLFVGWRRKTERKSVNSDSKWKWKEVGKGKNAFESQKSEAQGDLLFRFGGYARTLAVLRARKRPKTNIRRAKQWSERKSKKKSEEDNKK